MSFGTTSSSSSSNVWTSIAQQLGSTLGTQLESLATGSTTSDTIKALKESSAEETASGISNIKESYGSSGMRYSSDVASAISKFSTQQSTALDTAIASAETLGAQTQLQALQEIISLGSGTSSTSSSSGTNAFSTVWKILFGM